MHSAWCGDDIPSVSTHYDEGAWRGEGPSTEEIIGVLKSRIKSVSIALDYLTGVQRYNLEPPTSSGQGCHNYFNSGSGLITVRVRSRATVSFVK